MSESFEEMLRTPIIMIKKRSLRIVLEKYVYEIDLITETVSVFVQDRILPENSDPSKKGAS